MTASVQGSVIDDANANGVRDSNESLPLWTPTIFADLNYNGALDAGEPSTTQAFSASTYRLQLPAGGTYLVRVILPDTYVATIPASGARTITIADGFTTLGSDFGGWRRGQYAARPFDDANGNGTREDTEFSAYRRALWADLDRDGVMDPNEPASTPNSSAAQLALRPGSYSMRLSTPTGWINTTAPDGVERPIDPGIGYLPEPLGQQPTRNVMGTVAQDTNGSEKLEPGDTVLAGWTVFADLNKNGVREAGEPFDVTDSDGTYALVSSALAGSFNLRLVNPSGQLNSFLRAYASGYTENVFGNDDVLLRVTNVAVGRLFADLNGNGVYESTTSYREHFAAGQLVYADVNNNGAPDAGEPTNRTDVSGFFNFAVPAGTYAIRPQPDNDYAINPAFPMYSRATFGGNNRVYLGALGLLDNRQTRSYAHVEGAVFHDLNRNSRLDPGEQPQAGQLVYIDVNGNLRRDGDEPSTLTGADGHYLLLDQQTTTGTGMRVETTSGWRNTQIGLTEGPSIQLYTGQSAFASLGIYAVPDVGLASSAFDVNDRQAIDLTFTHDVGASLQGGDFVLSMHLNGNWVGTPTQFAVDSSSVQDGRTLATLRLQQLLPDGIYRMTLLPQSVADAAGVKNPQAQQLEFFILGADANGDKTVNDADYAIVQANFGQSPRTFEQGDFNYDNVVDDADRALLLAVFGKTLAGPAGSVQGTVFNDVNADGVFGAGEPGLAGRSVYLDVDQNGALSAGEPTRVTDSQGRYTFASMGPGNYTVRQVQLSGWRKTTPAAGHAFALALGENALAKNFGNTTRAQVSGFVFNDINGDGIKQSTERGLAGWRVFLDMNNNGVLDSGESSVLTAADGSYTANLPPGTYRGRVVVQSGWARTSPVANGGSYVGTLASAQIVIGANFGVRQLRSSPLVEAMTPTLAGDRDQPLYEELGFV
jgi:hypothetical protein